VTVSGQRDGNELVVSVANPCPPADQRRSGNGMALANIRARIAYHFGERGRLDIVDQGETFRCTMRLPYAAPGSA
jgi:two-component system sensor histidine kinase AlgZ